MNHPTASLSPMQKTCLRLVYEHRQSKEIARELNLSRYTVETHIKTARARLGAATRLEAARILVSEEGPPATPQQASSPPIAICPEQISPPSLTIVDGAGAKEKSLPNRLPWGSDSGLHKAFPLPREWGEKNDLGIQARLWWMIGLTGIICLSFGAVVASLQALSDLF
jgi:DNA-binding CsgD family transcriptional regulator